MSRRQASKAGRKTASRKTKPKALLLFGEDDNDRRAVKALLEGLRPDLKGCVQLRRKPLVLIKGVTARELKERALSLKNQVAIDRARFDVSGVVVHEDCDAVEPAHEAAAGRYAKEFARADFAVYPVLPAWELEAWWLLWPSMLPLHRGSWRAPTEHRGKRVGIIKNAKEKLRDAVVPRGLPRAARGAFRAYQESDSPGIAALLAEHDKLGTPEGRSDSYDAFRATAATITL